jgi:hypothetical protein
LRGQTDPQSGPTTLLQVDRNKAQKGSEPQSNRTKTVRQRLTDLLAAAALIVCAMLAITLALLGYFVAGRALFQSLSGGG